ncbi:hypothetical protein [Nonomuraea sp. NPDC049400]|uniref:hypothetical protein n=1 Tax=Nonomuraea sp. NPDC049400 TaxID=3364352 RepID=UPI00378FC190
MPQVYKGERRTTTFRPDPELKQRLLAAADAHGYRHLDNYLVALLGALHPDPGQEPKKVKPAANLLEALLDSSPQSQQEELNLSTQSNGYAAA